MIVFILELMSSKFPRAEKNLNSSYSFYKKGKILSEKVHDANNYFAHKIG